MGYLQNIWASAPGQPWVERGLEMVRGWMGAYLWKSSSSLLRP